MGQSLAIPRIIPEDWKRLDLIVNKIKMRLGSTASPTHVGLTLTGLTASRLIWGDANKALASKDLVDLVAGTANEIAVTDDTTGGIVIGIVDPLIVSKGGTGVATLTDHGLLVGSGTAAITALGVASNGQLPIGSAGADPVLATLTGTSNQVTVTNAAGSITLSLPQDIHTGASPTFTGGTFTAVVTGVLPTAGAHFATKEYVDLAGLTSRDYWLSNTASGIGSNYLCYPAETGEAASTLTTSPLGQGDDQLAFQWITEAGEPGIEKMRTGVYRLHTHLSIGTGDKPTTFYWTLSKVDADGTSNETLLMTSEESDSIGTTMTSFETHANLSTAVAMDATSRLILKMYANVGATGGDSEVTVYMEGTHDCHFSIQAPSSIWQNQGDVLDDLNTLGQSTADGEFLVATGAGALAWESGATARASMGVTIGTHVQAYDAGLTSLAGLTYASDSFIKVTAEDTYAIRTLAETKTDLSLNLVENTALSTWAGTTNITTLGTIATGTWQATDVGIAYGGTGQSTAQLAINALSAVSGATNEHILTKDTATGNAIFKVAIGGGAHTIASHSDTTGTGPELDELTDGSETVLHSHGKEIKRMASSVYASGAVAVTTATWTKVQLDTEDYDRDGEFDSTTNYRFQPNVAGYYHISAVVELDSLGDGKRVLAGIYKNGTLWKSTAYTSGGANITHRVPISCDMFLLTTDYVELYVYHDHGSNRNVGTTARQTFMDIHRFA